LAEYNRMYSLARYYDIVFRRDVEPEVDFVAELYRQRLGRAPRSAIDLACGPGYHARAFARRGMRAIGLDLRPEMIALAGEQAAAAGESLEWLVGDMRDFALAEPVDVALAPFDAIDCLLANDDLVAHFQAVARNLTDGGLYLVDMTHPRDCAPNAYGDFRYVGERDGCRVEIDWAVNRPIADPITNVAAVEVLMRVTENGRTSTHRDRAQERFLSAQEIALLAERSGALRAVAWFGAYDLAQPFDLSPGAHRLIAVLAKHGATTNWVSPCLAVGRRPVDGRSGMYARAPIAPGEVVAVWGGDVVDGATLAGLDERARRHGLQVGDDQYMVPNRPPEPGDLINHSCDPTCGMAGEVTVVARRAVRPGEEITIDYAMTDSTAYCEFACSCGTPSCRGRVTGDDWRSPELRARYAGFFSPYLRRRIEGV
jgi:SAM-dependent methyltransferase